MTPSITQNEYHPKRLLDHKITICHIYTVAILKLLTQHTERHFTSRNRQRAAVILVSRLAVILKNLYILIRRRPRGVVIRNVPLLNIRGKISRRNIAQLINLVLKRPGFSSYLS